LHLHLSQRWTAYEQRFGHCNNQGIIFKFIIIGHEWSQLGWDCPRLFVAVSLASPKYHVAEIVARCSSCSSVLWSTVSVLQKPT
jgi:hypothetical protein